MKKVLIVLFLVVITAGLMAETSAGSANGMTLNGSTGLILVPDARIGWENAKFGVDVGYAFVWPGGSDFDHLPRFSVSIAQLCEIYGLFHFNPDLHSDFDNLVVGTKFRIVNKGGTRVALGADVEFANSQPAGFDDYISSKIYVAFTYSGKFFDVPAVTTATFGWQFVEQDSFSWQFLYGMGFSVSMFPDTFKNHVFWITDFSNFSYTIYNSNIPLGRGAFNTGIRIRPFREGRFNMVIDLLGTDLLDNSRGLSVNVSAGLAF